MALTLVCGFECQQHTPNTNGTTEDGHWDSTVGTAPTIVDDAGMGVDGSPRTGTYAMKSTGDGTGDGNMRHQPLATSSNVGYCRFYFMLPDVANTAECRLGGMYESGAPRAEVHKAASSGVIRAETFDGSQSSTNNFTPSAGVWYGIEIESIQGSGMKWRTWNAGGSGAWSTSETITDATQTVVSFFNIGVDGGDASYVCYYDDVAAGFSSSSEDYDDTGTNGVDGFVTRLDPTSDGTHNIGTSGDFTGNPLTPVVGASTTAYGNLDAADMEQTTDYIESETGAATTEYVEVHFENEVLYDLPRGVMVVHCYDASSGTPTPGDLDISDDGSTWDTVTSPGSVTASAPEWLNDVLPDVPSDASAWTRTDVNNLRARWHGNGATGANARLTALALEVEWTSETPPIYVRPDGDESSANWETAPLWSKVDEDPGSPDGTTITVSVS
jgi:hypothetical protein